MTLTATSAVSSGQQIEEIFNRKVFRWRVYASLARAILLQFAAFAVYSGLRGWVPRWTSGVDPEDHQEDREVPWMMPTLLHPTSWFYDLTLSASLAGFGFFVLSDNFDRPSRFVVDVTSGNRSGGALGVLLLLRRRIWGFLWDPKAWSSLAGHLFLAAVLIRSYLGLLGGRYGSLTVLCSDFGGDRCLNEPHIFLVLSGCYTGLSMWWDYHFKNGHVIQFPPVQQSGNDQLRQKVGPLLKESCHQVFRGLGWFYIYHLVMGRRVQSALSDLMHLDVHGGYAPGAGVWAIVGHHLGLGFECWCVNSLLTFNVGLLRTIFNINMTKRMRFPAVAPPAPASSSSDDDNVDDNVDAREVVILLTDAMASKNQLLKHLAFQDFALLAAESQVRRSDFFAISQPGGHPYNWQAVKDRCLKVIGDFVKDLNEASRQASMQRASAAAASAAAAAASTSSGFNKAAYNPASSPPPPPPPAGLRLRRLGMAPQLEQQGGRVQEIMLRGLSMPPLAEGHHKGPPAPAPPPGIGETFGLLPWFMSLVKDKIYHLGSSSSLSSSSPDEAVRTLYAGSQLVIWAVEGISYLVAASIAEDRYGVVQMDLAQVIESLLTLQQTVERHKGTTATARKNRFDSRDLQLKQELRVTIKSSLYRISVAFGEHLEALPLAPEFKKRISNYKHFMEG